MEYAIGQAAKAADMTASTLRYYEQEGLIVAKRHENGRRYFDQEDVNWLKFIHHMRSTDMPIADLARYVKLRRQKVEGSQQELLLIMKKHERHLIKKMAHYQSNLDLVRYKISMYEHELKDRDTDLFELFKERRCATVAEGTDAGVAGGVVAGEGGEPSIRGAEF